MKTKPNSASLITNEMPDFSDPPAAITSCEPAWEVQPPAENHSLPQIDPVLPPEPRTAMQWFMSRKAELARLEREHHRLEMQAELGRVALRANHEQQMHRIAVAAEALRAMIRQAEQEAADRRCSMTELRLALRDFTRGARERTTPLAEKHAFIQIVSTLSLRLVELNSQSALTLGMVFTAIVRPVLAGAANPAAALQLKEQY